MRYWLVHNPNRGAPNKQHITLDAARAEAERLAGLHPGESIYVLEVVGVAVTERPKVQWSAVVDDDAGPLDPTAG